MMTSAKMRENMEYQGNLHEKYFQAYISFSGKPEKPSYLLNDGGERNRD